MSLTANYIHLHRNTCKYSSGDAYVGGRRYDHAVESVTNALFTTFTVVSGLNTWLTSTVASCAELSINFNPSTIIHIGHIQWTSVVRHCHRTIHTLDAF